MREAGSVEAYVASPIGRYRWSATWLSFCADERCSGIAMWGRPSLIDTKALLDIMPTEPTLPLAQSKMRLIDVRWLTSIDTSAFGAFSDYLATNAQRLIGVVERVAIVHHRGLAGALSAGISEVVSTPYPVQRFDDLEAALGWLGVRAHPLAVELDEIIDAARCSGALRRQLREVLARDLRGVDLGGISSALGASPRTLQRRLKTIGSSFQRELSQARVDLAQQLLLEGDQASIKEVAFAVGCMSVQHFGRLFRRITGVTPSEWQRRRGARQLLRSATASRQPARPRGTERVLAAVPTRRKRRAQPPRKR